MDIKWKSGTPLSQEAGPVTLLMSFGAALLILVEQY